MGKSDKYNKGSPAPNFSTKYLYIQGADRTLIIDWGYGGGAEQELIISLCWDEPGDASWLLPPCQASSCCHYGGPCTCWTQALWAVLITPMWERSLLGNMYSSFHLPTNLFCFRVFVKEPDKKKIKGNLHREAVKTRCNNNNKSPKQQGLGGKSGNLKWEYLVCSIFPFLHITS